MDGGVDTTLASNGFRVIDLRANEATQGVLFAANGRYFIYGVGADLASTPPATAQVVGLWP
jgi:hypothetical protein